jgi:hypothetical protein
MIGQEQRKGGKDHRDYRLGEVFFAGGKAWGVDEELRTICLGKEEDILPVLKGEKPIPDSATPSQRKVLAQILEDMEFRHAGTTEVRGSRPVRSRPIGVVRHRQTDSGRPKARKRFPIR